MAATNHIAIVFDLSTVFGKRCSCAPHVVPCVHTSQQPNSISIGSAVFAGLTVVTNTQTMLHTEICSYLALMLRCGLLITKYHSAKQYAPTDWKI